MMLLRSCFLALLAAPMFADGTLPGGNGLVVHEWGTFTTVADTGGQSVLWYALGGAAELPCFVHRLPGPIGKGNMGTVRLETPVLYFYSAQKVRASVHVDFRAGAFTEWYPQAKVGETRNAIDWAAVDVTPGVDGQLPVSKGPSRYFAARATDASPVQAGQEREKLIFYRGLGYFSAPLSARVTADGALELRNLGPNVISTAIVFDNHNGRTGYRVVTSLKDRSAVDLGSLSGDTDALQRELQSLLVSLGLYPKEAAAMIETWKDSWFEEGTRVFWMAPRATVDDVLPVRIQPAPSALTRVFVGRIEVLSPAMRSAILTALASGNIPALQRYTRFLDPFLRQLAPGSGRPSMASNVRQFLDAQQSDLIRERSNPFCVE